MHIKMWSRTPTEHKTTWLEQNEEYNKVVPNVLPTNVRGTTPGNSKWSYYHEPDNGK